jgi:hypothetical protein
VIGFGAVVGVLLEDVPRARHQLLDHPRVNRRPVGGDLDRRRTRGQRLGEERPVLRLRRGAGRQGRRGGWAPVSPPGARNTCIFTGGVVLLGIDDWRSVLESTA